MFKKIIISLALMSSFSAFSMENPVFESLKADMWDMGLSFEYIDGTHIIKPLNTNGHEITDDRGMTEEITHALNI